MRDLIIVGNNLANLPTASVEVVKCLKNVARVIWVNINYCSPTASFNGDRPLLSLPRKRMDEVQSLTLSVKLAHDIPGSSVMGTTGAKQQILAQLHPFLRKHHVSRPLIWTSDLNIADIHLSIDGASLVFYSDREFDNSATEMMQELAMIQHADIIFGATEKICARYPSSKTFLLRHGVDLKLFCSPTSAANDLPRNKPVAGYYGSLDHSIDYQMLLLCALSTPDWNFVILGKNTLPYYPLPKLNNVFYLGDKEHRQLPSYSQHWQACLLPLNTPRPCADDIEAKLLEYLAVGSPVISSAQITDSRFNKYINHVDSAYEMSNALKLAAYEPKGSADIVFSDCWQVRSRYVDNILNRYSLSNL
ncbi:hypothetical protein BIY20_02315 [Vibrio panuliri]|uniref:Glycosyl transferase n=2 Tax=Vibrio panuliri TaxID=1381081 RepID=A0ABX3FB68_9VIBR|nr:hypothetical protein BIY20_02315 [Vibrio panuliri]